MRRHALVLGAVVAAAVALTAAATAHANATQFSIMEDDHLLLWSGDSAREAALDEMHALGVTTVHVLVIWTRLAPAPKSYQRPAVDLADPSSYGSWAPFDAVAAGAAARGMRVLFTPTGPVPAWASDCPRSAEHRSRCKPNVADYGAFVHALAERYSGNYQGLPRVGAWSLWNEPNHKAWLIPQTTIVHGVTIYSGAERYRSLVHAGLAALAQTGHASDLRLIGETAPVASHGAAAPLDFYRELFCLDPSLRPYRGPAARLRGCTTRPRFAVSGIAHHPYTSGGLGSPFHRAAPGDVSIADLPRLVKLLDHAAGYGSVPQRLPLYLTEFGFQSRPPDPYGVSLAQQAAYMNYSDWVAYRNPRVASVAQYELRDDRARAGFNTGLRFAGGRPKPALAAYRLPLWVIPAGPGYVRVFGGARSAATLPATVLVEARRSTRDAFRVVARVRTNAAGWFAVRVRHRGRYWRLALGAALSRAALTR